MVRMDNYCYTVKMCSTILSSLGPWLNLIFQNNISPTMLPIRCRVMFWQLMQSKRMKYPRWWISLRLTIGIPYTATSDGGRLFTSFIEKLGFPHLRISQVKWRQVSFCRFAAYHIKCDGFLWLCIALLACIYMQLYILRCEIKTTPGEPGQSMAVEEWLLLPA